MKIGLLCRIEMMSTRSRLYPAGLLAFSMVLSAAGAQADPLTDAPVNLATTNTNPENAPIPPPETNQGQTGPVGPGLEPVAPSAPSGFALHGFADLSLKNFYATPRGLLVTNKGLTLQLLDGLVADFGSDRTGTLNDMSITAGTWTDFNPGYESGNRNNVNELDWFVGISTLVGKRVKVGVQYVQFDSPQRAYIDEKNMEFSIAYDDSKMYGPFSIQPYAKLFYAIAGGATVVTGRAGNTFDVEIGAIPAYTATIGAQPLILTLPTWFTVGPASYWGGDSHFGVVSTGLKGTLPLGFIPKRWGDWYADTGVQFYHELNSKLVDAQYLLGTATPDTNGHRNFAIWSVGLGLTF